MEELLRHAFPFWESLTEQQLREAAKAFAGEDAEILHNINWQDVEKNQ